MADDYCVLPATAVVEARQYGSLDTAMQRAHERAESDGMSYVVVAIVHEVDKPLPGARR